MSTEERKNTLFLFRFLESEEAAKSKSINASPEKGGESNPIEEEPKPEPSKKTPYGD